MRCLWLTLADPEPRHSGEFVYSGGLIDAVAQAGVSLDVLARARGRPGNGGGHALVDRGVQWWLIDHAPRAAWTSVVSPLPHLANRAVDPAKERKLRQLLEAEDWDSLVFDGVSSGWALGQVRQWRQGRPRRARVIYISHNHETSLRDRIAGIEANYVRRQLRCLEARKVSRLEAALIAEADLVTAITPEDQSLYRAGHPGKTVDVLTPGYGGTQVAARRITSDLPRRAVIVGSYDWVAKRANLEEFLTVADPLVARAGVELQVVGSADAAALARWRERFPATRFSGAVEDVAPFMEQARVAIVPERHGGGFKLKVLDYVFNRMPILALEGSFAGVPLRRDDSVLVYPDHAGMARDMIRAIDDVDQLNGLQERAYVACRDEYHWSRRGAFLAGAMAAA